MRNLIIPAAIALLAGALPAAAAPADAPANQAPAQAPAAAATGSAAPTASTAAATVTVGLPVKDKTGAVIGEIAEVKPSADGQTATVKMGEQRFSVSTQSFAVQGGAAVLNATKAELQSMIANAGKGG